MMNSTTTNTGPGFNNVQNTPTIAQPATPANSNRILLNKDYIFSLPGILRILIIIFQFAGWVSAAAVPILFSGQYAIFGEISATRDAYLFFSIVGFIFAVFIFVFNALNIVNVGFLSKIPWILVVLGNDVLWLIPTFVLGIVAAVRESNYPNYSIVVNKGAFGSAAFFALLLTVIYAVDAALHIFKLVRSGVRSPPTYQP